jgi:hypothetical protein
MLGASRDPARARQWLAQLEALWVDADAPVKALLARARARVEMR